MTDTPATVRVMVGWNDDYENYWLRTCEPGEADDEPHSQEGDIPAELWERWNALHEEADGVLRQIVELVDVEEGGRRRQPCATYNGEHSDGRRWWSLLLAASDGTEWPVHEAQIGYTSESEDEARRRLDELPDEFWFAGRLTGWPVKVTKDRLRIEEHGFNGSWSECQTCGHPRDAHVLAGGANGGVR